MGSGGAGAGAGAGGGAGTVVVVAERTDPEACPPADENTTLVRPSGAATIEPPLTAASRAGSVLVLGGGEAVALRGWNARESDRPAAPLPLGATSASGAPVRLTGRSTAGERR